MNRQVFRKVVDQLRFLKCFVHLDRRLECHINSRKALSNLNFFQLNVVTQFMNIPSH